MRRQPLRIDTTKYLAATNMLDATEHGALLSIMLNVFDVSGRTDIADDNLQLSRLAGTSQAHWLRLKPAIMLALRKDGDRLSFAHLLRLPKKRAGR